MSDEYLYGDYRILRADRMPCPVCGHPTGDCKPHQQESPIQNPIGTGLFPSLDKQTKIMLEEDILEERIMYGNVKIKVIKFHKGQMITVAQAREHGLLNE